MVNYIIRRLIYSVPLFIAISIMSFVIIQLPPGDYMTQLETQLQSQSGMSQAEAREVADRVRETYGLDRPLIAQYFSWIRGILAEGKFGFSFQYKRDAGEVIWPRLGKTVLLALTCQILALVVGLSIGIYSATHQYTLGDNVATVLAFIGISIPQFFFALIIMYTLVFWFDVAHVGGFHSPDYVFAPWSWAKLVDFLKHFWQPVLVAGLAGTAGNMRVMRGNLLDTLRAQYVVTARAKGATERTVIYRHAVVNALHPIIMDQGMALPYLIQGTMVTAIVMNLPTTGPMFYEALVYQDMYLAGSFLMMLAAILVVGNIVADFVLSIVDPRIRFD